MVSYNKNSKYPFSNSEMFKILPDLCLVENEICSSKFLLSPCLILKLISCLHFSPNLCPETPLNEFGANKTASQISPENFSTEIKMGPVNTPLFSLDEF